MKKNKKKNSKLIVAIVLLLLIGVSIGYAAITSSLNILGNISIGKSTWNVHFENVKVTTGSVTATTAPTVPAGNTSTTLLNYAITLAKPGDFYEFTVDVKNGGTLDAKLNAAPTLSGVSTAQDVYTNYKVTYSDGTAPKANDTLTAGATKKLKVRVEYDKNITASQLPTTEQTLNLTFDAQYIQLGLS